MTIRLITKTLPTEARYFAGVNSQKIAGFLKISE
jgi:hypothetical protein